MKLNINKQNNGQTLIHECINSTVNINDKIKNLKTIVNGSDKVNVNIKNNNGETPLILAIKNKETPIIEFLVKECNIDVNLQDNAGKTPLDIAHEAYFSSDLATYNDIYNILKAKNARLSSLQNKIEHISQGYKQEEENLQNKADTAKNGMILIVILIVCAYTFLFIIEYLNPNNQISTIKIKLETGQHLENNTSYEFLHILLIPVDIMATIAMVILYRIYIRTQALANHFTHKRTALDLFITMREAVPPSDLEGVREWDNSIRDLMKENPLEILEKGKKDLGINEVSKLVTAFAQLAKDPTSKKLN